MEVKAGYKETEVGVIPDNWDVKNLGELVSLRTGPFGSSVHKSDYINGGVPFINPIHIFNGELFPDPNITLSPETVARLSEFQLRANDIILGRRGEMGRCAVVRDDQQGWLCGSGSMILRPNSKIVPEYLQRIMSSPYAIARIEEASVGSTMINLNQAVIFSLSIPYPPLFEQEAIAEALSDADALIESLEQLIAKKRQIKQGAMQELLTGKKRLPAFSGEWSITRMREILTQNATYGIVTAGAFVQNGVKMVRGGDIADGRVNTDLPMVSRDKAVEYSRTALMRNDVVIALVGYPGEAAKIPEELIGSNISRAVGLLRLNSKVSPDYLVCFLNSPNGRRMVLAPSAGSAQQVVNLAALNKLEFAIPELAEQEAIAAILSDMDAEIAALDAKLAKARQLKQGMMQELLTGRIRLI